MVDAEQLQPEGAPAGPLRYLPLHRQAAAHRRQEVRPAALRATLSGTYDRERGEGVRVCVGGWLVSDFRGR